MNFDHEGIRRVRELIAVSEAYQKDRFLEARRPDHMWKWFRGEHYAAELPLAAVDYRDQVTVNYAQRNVLLKMAQIAFGPPAFNVVPHDSQSELKALDQKRHLEHVWREIKAYNATRRALLDTRVTGTGLCGVQWLCKTRLRTYTDQSERPEEGEKKGQEVNILLDQPHVRRVSPYSALFDPDSPDDLQAGRWMGEKIIRPLEHLRRLPKYSHIADKLKGDTRYSEKYQTSLAFYQDSDQLKAVTFYVLYLWDVGARIEWTDEVPDQLMFAGDRPEIDYPLTPDGVAYFPYVRLRGVPDGESAYGMGDIEIAETQQVEINAARSQLAARRRCDGSIYMADGTVMTQDLLDEIESAPDRAIVLIQKGLKPGQKLSDVMVPLQRQQVQPELYATYNEAKMDMAMLTGLSMEERGLGGAEKFATQTAMIAQTAGDRKALERVEYEEGVAEIATQVAWLEHRWGDKERHIKAEEGWTTLRGVELAGNYSFFVEPASMSPPSDAMDEQLWQGRLMALAPFGASGINLTPVIERYLQSFDFENTEEVLGGMTDGLQFGGPEGGPGAPEGGEEEGDLSGLLSLAGAPGAA